MCWSCVAWNYICLHLLYTNLDLKVFLQSGDMPLSFRPHREVLICELIVVFFSASVCGCLKKTDLMRSEEMRTFFPLLYFYMFCIHIYFHRCFSC